MKKFKSLKKWQMILIGVVAFILIVIIALVVKAKLSGGNYYDDLDKVMSNNVGKFKYVIDVQTSRHKDSDELKADSVSLKDLEGIESATSSEADEQESEEAQEENNKSKYEYAMEDNWGNKEDTKTGDWQYPSYKVTIEGCTSNLNPYTAQITISLATEFFSDKFTEIVCFDGNYYIDIEQIRYWLIQSKDSYLVSIGNNLPEGSKYLVIPEDKMIFNSRYAEDDEEAITVGLKTLLNKYIVTGKYVKGYLSKSLGKTGLSSSDDLNYISISGKDGVKVLSAIKSLINNGDVYTDIINLRNKNKLYDEVGYKQAQNEKDNVLDAFSKLAMYLNTADLEACNLSINGASRKYKNMNKVDIIECSLNTAMTTGDTDYKINISAIHYNSIDEIKLPMGSQTKIDDIKEFSPFRDAMNSLVDYCNISSIKLSNKLALTPENLELKIKDELIETINAKGTSSYYVTRNNLQRFINAYANYKETDESTENDKANAKLVEDYMKALNNITGGVVKTIQVEKEEELEKYPKFEKEVNGVVYKGSVDESSLSNQVAEVKLNIKNTTDANIDIDLTNFSLRTLLSSKYPSNNEVLIRNYDNNYNFNSLKKSITVKAGESVDTKLVFVLSEDTGYMDIWYGEENLGVAFSQ